MADFDAGTARAHIKVDGDARGADQATRAVQGFQRALEFIANHLGGFIAAMDKVDAELNNVEREFKSAADAANKYDRAVDDITAAHIKASRSTSDLGKNIQDLHGRLKFAHDAWADYGIPIIQATRAMNEFSKTKGGVLGVFQAVNRAGIAGAAVAAMKSHFIGMGIALRQAPAWQQQMARLAQNIGLVTLAGSRVGMIVPLMERGFARLVRGAEGADFAMAGFSRTLSGLDSVTGTVGRFFQTLDRVPTGLFQMAGGMAVASSGMRSLQNRWRLLSTAFGQGGGMIGKALRFVLLPGIILSQAAVQGLDVALRGLSNTVAGLWSGIKQLAGGFLAIPGLIATIGAAAIPLVAIVKTITSNFKDMIKAVSDNDVEKFAEAMQKIPPYLRPLAQAVANAVQPLKDLGNVLTATFVGSGLDRQFTQLINAWLPAITVGADQVANSWKIVTNHVAAFLGESKTITGVNTIFMNTSQILNTVGNSIQPILAGFRDIAVVGSSFIRDLALTYLPQIANKFGSWAQNAAATGKAMQWMKNSVDAAKNLYVIVDQAVRAVYSLLTLFQTQPGDTWLHRIAVEMTKFNNAVERSKASGELHKIADAVKGMGTDKLGQLRDMFKDMLPTIRGVLHTLSDIGQAFSAVMLPAIQLVLPIIQGLLDALNALGLGSAIGGILGVVKAFGLLRAVVGPLWDMFKVGFGLRTAFAGVENVINGLANSLQNMGSLGARAAGGLRGISGAITAMAGPITVAIAAIVAGFTLWAQNNSYIAAGNKEIADSAAHATDATNKLRDAFVQDRGQVGKNVISTYADNIRTAMQDISDQAAKAPGIMDHLGQLFRTDAGNQSWNPFAQSDAFNDMQRMFDQSKKVQEGLQGLGISANQVADAITSGSPKIDEWANKAQSMGEAGKAAADWLEQQKIAFDRMAASAAAAGPGALQVSAGLDKIAQSGGDATQRLEGLKTVLQGLGLLQTDAYEAAANLAKSVQDLGDAARNAADPTQTFDDIINKNNGTLNVWTANGRNLLNVLTPLAQNFLAAANSGTDVTAAYQKIGEQLPALAESFHVSIQDIQRWLASLGVDPKAVNILLQVQGKDKVTQEISQVLVTAQANIGNGVQVPVHFKDDQMAQEAAAAINKIFGPGSVTQEGANIFLKPGIDPAAIAKLEQELASKGIKLTPDSPNPPPGATATIPAVPAVPPRPLNVPAPGATPPADKKPPTTPLPPGVTLPQSMVPQDQQTPPAQMTPPPAPPPITPAPPPVAPPPAAAPPPAPAQAPAPVKIPVEPPDLSGFDKIQDAFKALAATLAKNIGEWNAWAGGVGGAVANALQAVKGALDAITKQANDSGKKFSSDFAAGITDPAALQKISDAAVAAMQQAANKLPHSPAKEGPLSGQGWSGHAGGALAQDFATGILGGQRAVGDAANKLAGKVAGALKPATAYGAFGFKGSDAPPKDLMNLFKIASDGLNLFKSVSDQIFKVVDFAKDPLGTKKKGDNAAAAGLGGGAGGIGGKGGATAALINQGADALFGNANPSKNDIASAIAGEAQKRGYDRNTAIAVISAAMHESSLDPNVTNASGHQSLFQTSADKGVGLNAGKQIQWMFNQLDSLGGPTAAANDPLSFIANNIEKGGYPGSALGQHAPDAAKLYDSVLRRGIGGGATAIPGGQYVTNPASLAASGGGNQRVGENDIRQWAATMFGIPNSFGTGSWENAVHPKDKGLHGSGGAFDFHGTRQQMDAMANYIAQNLAGQTMELIYSSPNFSPSNLIKNTKFGDVYGPDTLAGHTDHVHWATDVAPILANANASALPAAAGNMPQQNAVYGTQNPIEQPGTPNIGADKAPGPAGVKQAGLVAALDPNDKAAAGLGQQEQQAQALQGQSQGIEDSTQQIQSVVSGASNIASSVMKTVQSGLDAWGATKYIMDQMVRGISDTEDVYKLVDEFQKYITFAADVDSTVGTILSTAGSFSGGADMGGVSAAGQAAQMISALLTTINSVIDMTQEAYRIWGSYFGQFLGFLAGGPGGMMGDVHFLLDQNTGQLLAYSSDNPLNKTAHTLPFQATNPNANNQLIGQLNYYAGPGEDPRDGTRNMMYQVRASTLSTVTAQ